MTIFSLILGASLLIALAVSSQVEETCQSAYCKKKDVDGITVTYAAFVKVDDVAFAITPNTTVQVSGTLEEREKKCVDHCIDVGLDNCKSVHLEAFQQSKITSECSVYSTDIYQYWPNQQQTLRESKTGWVSFHVKNTFCEKGLCKNEAYCAADFEKDDGKCVCAGYSGKFCQTYDVLHFDDVGYWNFNNGTMDNVGLGQHLGHGINDFGIISHVPGRKSPVIMCNKDDFVWKCFSVPRFSDANCYKITTSPSGEDFCPTGFTLAFWIRALRNTDGSTTIFRYIRGTEDQLINVVVTDGVMILALDFSKNNNRCEYADGEQFYNKWNFIALTWNPVNKTLACAHNENVMAATVSTISSTRPVNTGVWFGTSTASVLFDDIVYFERTSNEETLKEIYKATKE